MTALEAYESGDWFTYEGLRVKQQNLEEYLNDHPEDEQADDWAQEISETLHQFRIEQKR